MMTLLATQRFKKGEFILLVPPSIGEEGLDILLEYLPRDLQLPNNRTHGLCALSLP